jgi:hypothetical protein
VVNSWDDHRFSRFLLVDYCLDDHHSCHSLQVVYSLGDPHSLAYKMAYRHSGKEDYSLACHHCSAEQVRIAEKMDVAYKILSVLVLVLPQGQDVKQAYQLWDFLNQHLDDHLKDKV